jgi:hypothetical protein
MMGAEGSSRGECGRVGERREDRQSLQIHGADDRRLVPSENNDDKKKTEPQRRPISTIKGLVVCLPNSQVLGGDFNFLVDTSMAVALYSGLPTNCDCVRIVVDKYDTLLYHTIRRGRYDSFLPREHNTSSLLFLTTPF